MSFRKSPTAVITSPADELSRINVLASTRKGRIVYENGWDANPNSFLKLVSEVQQTDDYHKSRILERTYQITLNDKDGEPEESPRNIQSASKGRISFGVEDTSSCSSSTTNEFFNNDYYESSTSSDCSTPMVSTPVRRPAPAVNLRSSVLNSRVSLSSRKSVPGSKSNTSATEDSSSRDITVIEKITSPLTGNISKRGLGVREEEYDDAECLASWFHDSLMYLSVIKEVNKLDADYKSQAEKKVIERNRSYAEGRQRSLNIEGVSPLRSKLLTPEQERRIAAAETEAKQKIDAFKLRLQVERTKQEELNKAKAAEHERVISECKRREEEAVAAAEVASKVAQQAALQQQQDKERAEADEKSRKEAQEAAAVLQAKQQQAAQSVVSSQGKGIDVPADFAGCVLPIDLQAYLRSQQLLSEYNEKTAHIKADSHETKTFYSHAVRIVNTTLNSIANSADHNQHKVNQLIQLLLGQPVPVGDTGVIFVSKSQPNGELFVANLLASRFLKKSQTEITKGPSSIEPLATLGVSVAAKCPHWGVLVRAYFYKQCPFLVPFSFPKRGLSVEEYATAMDHAIKGTEATISQALIDRWKGYCMLYGMMVKIVERQKVQSLGETTEFFSLGEVWKILSTTMKLTPQIDLTATTIQILLETVGDRLLASYGAQFKKLIFYLIVNYTKRIREVTPQNKAAAVTRLELALEKLCGPVK